MSKDYYVLLVVITGIGTLAGVFYINNLDLEDKEQEFLETGYVEGTKYYISLRRRITSVINVVTVFVFSLAEPLSGSIKYLFYIQINSFVGFFDNGATTFNRFSPF